MMNREKKEKERKINKLYASRRFSFFSFFFNRERETIETFLFSEPETYIRRVFVFAEFKSKKK